MKGFRRACEWYCASKLCSRGLHWTKWPLILMRKMLRRPLKCRQEAKPCKVRVTSFMLQGAKEQTSHQADGKGLGTSAEKVNPLSPSWGPSVSDPTLQETGSRD